jgi:PAT family beta-lactamase induction signal transducer AmpG
VNDVTAVAERPAARIWRLTAISALSSVSGMPLGLVFVCVPGWLAIEKIDIKTIGLITLAQAPWAFKFLWSPLMDRFAVPFLGRKRGWIFACQATVAAAVALLGINAVSFDVGVVAGLSLLIAFVGASFDIAYDAYAVEVLTKQEHGLAVGLRSALYRAGMFFSGHLMISLGPLWGWRKSMFALAGLFVFLLPVVWFAPEPKVLPAPVRSLKQAVWEPFVGMLSRPRALEILAFVTFYRLAASLSDALASPFLIQHGYDPVAVGAFRGGVVMLTTIGGTVFGGVLTQLVGTSRALWIAGVLQAAGILGFIALAQTPVNNLAMYAALGIEAGFNGMAWGAFGVLLLRMTDKRFSATQYALFSSLVGLTRTLVGPIAGLLADALGWRDFFVFAIFCGLPGLLFLRRFAPWGHDTSDLSADTAVTLPRGAPWERSTLTALGIGAGVAFAAFGLLVTGGLRAIKTWRSTHAVDLVQAMLPTDPIDVFGSVLLGVCGGLAVAAYLAARGRRNVTA